MKKIKGVFRLGDGIGDYLQHSKLQKGLDRVQIEEVWREQMGPAIMKYTNSIFFDNGTLYVSLNSSVLREELSYGKDKIIRMLNEELRTDLIKKLVLR